MTDSSDKMSKMLDIKYDIMEEEFAYSMGIQAYTYGQPLTIFERERRIRLDPVLLEQQQGTAPAAPLNQIGHMDHLATSDDILPYTPNRDTIYSGALLELVDEPVILKAPDILDRYWCVEVADTFTENRFYLGSRTTDGYGGNHAFVGPNFYGDLPDDVIVHKLPYNSIMFALRIGIDINNVDEDTNNVLAYQKQFSLTSLSEWKKGNIGVAAVPESVKAQPNYTDPLGIFRLIAGLMVDNPPQEIHAAQWKPFHYIGLVAGEQFEPEKLSKATRAGLIRAGKMSPQIMQWKVKYRGTPYETRWNKLAEGTYHTDFLDRAAGCLEGLFVHDYVECTYYSTYESYVPASDGEPSRGEFFNSDFKYKIHFDAYQIPDSKQYGFWSLTMYGPDFQLVDNEINRYSISVRTDTVTKNDDKSVDFYFQADKPTDPKRAGNWLPAPKPDKNGGKLFRLNYRIYLPVYNVLYPSNPLQYIPPITKIED